jgi:hypothetical protein
LFPLLEFYYYRIIKSEPLSQNITLLRGAYASIEVCDKNRDASGEHNETKSRPILNFGLKQIALRL